MAARVATWLAIVLGGTGGTAAALLGGRSEPAPAPTASVPMRSISQVAAQVQAAKPSGAPVANGTPSGAQAVADASAAAAASSAPPVTLPAAELLPLPTTKEKLLRAEMHCDQRKSEDCIVAARSFETGSTGVTDLEKATRYRKIALTAWISQCDHNSAAACSTLAAMYRAGSGVPQNDRNADALILRTRELCRFNDAPVCHELPAL